MPVHEWASSSFFKMWETRGTTVRRDNSIPVVG
jgi:hypothetical protein